MAAMHNRLLPVMFEFFLEVSEMLSGGNIHYKTINHAPNYTTAIS